MSNYRNTPVSRRANEQAKQAIAAILLYEISDPRLQLVTITSVDVSPDKRNAKIYYTTNKEMYSDVEESFASAKGYIKKMLGDRLNWRVVPDISFYIDQSVDIGEQIAKAFEKEGIEHP